MNSVDLNPSIYRAVTNPGAQIPYEILSNVNGLGTWDYQLVTAPMYFRLKTPTK